MAEVAVVSTSPQERCASSACPEPLPVLKQVVQLEQEAQIPKAFSRESIILELLNRDLPKGRKLDEESIKLLAEDLKEVSTAALMLVNKNGGSIRIVEKGETLYEAGFAPKVDLDLFSNNNLIELLNEARAPVDLKHSKARDALSVYVAEGATGDQKKRIQALILYSSLEEPYIKDLAEAVQNVTNSQVTVATRAPAENSDAKADFIAYVAGHAESYDEARVLKKIIGRLNPGEIPEFGALVPNVAYYRSKDDEKKDPVLISASDAQTIEAWESGTINGLYSENERRIYLKSSMLSSRTPKDQYPGDFGSGNLTSNRTSHEFFHSYEHIRGIADPDNQEAYLKARDAAFERFNKNDQLPFEWKYSRTSPTEFAAETGSLMLTKGPGPLRAIDAEWARVLQEYIENPPLDEK